MKDLIKKAKMYFAMRKADKELTEAIITAEEKWRLHNTRFFVIPDTAHRLRVLSWSQIKQMRTQGLFSNHAKEPDFIRESFYYTPSRVENGMFLTPESKEKKRKEWRAYYQAYRMN